MSIPADAWPAGDLLSWHDDEQRLVWDFTTEPHSSRPYTDEENAAADERETQRVAEGNRVTLTERARAALAGNADFLALTSPTNVQTLAQVRALTRQMNAVIRLVVGDLSSDT